MTEDWTPEELTAIVADYFAMLSLELAGNPYNKSKHRRALIGRLNQRSEGAIEFKHCNISAALHQLNLPSISGYKPRHNFQMSLVDSINAWLVAHPEFLHIVDEDVQRLAKPVEADLQKLLDEVPPIMKPPVAGIAFNRKVTPVTQVNWLAKEAANQSLGAAGEQLVLEYEDQRLRRQGQKKLAERIEHTSSVVGDGAGFDILSYEPTGQPRHIEVKTTKYGKETPFWLSANELNFSTGHADSYFLYRVYNFRKNPRLFVLDGSIEKHCHLKPQQFIASF